jgi:nucleotide-binding universal stress UspA family protein
MKTILVPTDFKEPASNALAYSAALAKIIQARIILCHIYHVPLPFPGDVPVLFNSQTDLEKPLRGKLEEIALLFSNGIGKGIPIECIASPGFAVDEITELAKEKEADFIIMGTGNGEHTFFGSVITGIVENCNKILIVVPGTAKFKKPRKIALACNYKEEIKPACMLDVKKIVTEFGAELFIVNVGDPQKEVSGEKIVGSNKIDNLLSGVEHTFYFSVHKDVVEGLVEFEDSHQMDMLIMIPKKHSFLNQLFHTSKTQKMALHSHIPILILHGSGDACE